MAFFLLALFTVVLFGRPTDLLPVRIHLAEIVGIAAIVGYVLAKLAGRLPLIWSTELKLVFALTLWFVLGVPFAYWRTGALLTLTETWLKTLVIFFLISQTVFTMERVRKLIWVIISCEFFVVSYSLLLRSSHVTSDQRFFGAVQGLLSGNYLGIAAAITFPYMLLLFAQKLSVPRMLLVLSTFAMTMWMVVLTASRGGFLAVVFSVGLSWLLVLRRTRMRLLGVALLLAIVLAMLFAPKVFWDRLGTVWQPDKNLRNEVQESAAKSADVREELLSQSLRWTWKHPLFGMGLGNFKVRRGAELGARGWAETHNSFTQVSSEAGIPALLLFILLLAVPLVRLRRIARSKSNSPEEFELSLYARATMVSIASFIFSGWFAQLAYDYYVYYFIGIGIALQTIYQRRAAATVKQTAPAASWQESA